METAPPQPRAKRHRLNQQQAPADWEQLCYLALQLCSDLGDAEALRLLRLHGADIGADSVHNVNGRSELPAHPDPTAGEFLARKSCKHGRTHVLRELARRGVNLLSSNRTGATAAHFATELGHFETLREVVSLAGAAALRVPNPADGGTCAHRSAANGHLKMLQWIVEEIGAATLRATTYNGRTPVMAAASEGRLQTVRWIVQALGPACLQVSSTRSGFTSVFYGMAEHDETSDRPLKVVEFIGETLGGEALRVRTSPRVTSAAALVPVPAYVDGPGAAAAAQYAAGHFDAAAGAGRVEPRTLLQCLEMLNGTEDEIPANAQAHFQRMLSVPDSLPLLLQCQRRLALAKAMHPHLGGSSSASCLVPDLMQAIATESGVLGERASYEAVWCWQEEQAEAQLLIGAASSNCPSAPCSCSPPAACCCPVPARAGEAAGAEGEDDLGTPSPSEAWPGA